MPAFAQTGPSPAAALSTSAQEALKKGLIAANQHDYPLAVRYFQEARKAKPAAGPEVLYDLALAESRIPGRELRAFCWFTAYLITNPQDPRANSIKDKLADLKNIHRTNVARLIGLVEHAASQVSAKWQSYDLDEVVDLWISQRDFPNALQVASRIQDANYRNGALIDIVYVQADTGDIAGAQNTLALAQSAANLIQSADDRESAQKRYAHAVNSIDKARAEAGSKARTLSSPPEILALLIDKLDKELTAKPFLDLAGYLKSLPPSDDPQTVFAALHQTASDVVLSQRIYDWAKP